MLKNHLKIAIRKMIRQKSYSFINIFGLGVTLAFFLLVISYVRDELNFDAFHSRSDRIFQVTTSISLLGSGASTSPAMAKALTSEFPEIRSSVRVWRMRHAIGLGDKIFNRMVGYADQTFFEVFSFPLENGEASQALSSPDQVVLARETARLFFGDEDPLGRTLTININERKRDFRVSGVLKDFPDNSSLRFDLLVPFENVNQVFDMAFDDSLVTSPMFHTTFLELRDSRQAGSLESKFPAFLERHYGEDIRKFKLNPGDFKLGLQKFTDYHLGAVGGSGALGARSLPGNSLILAGIAFMTLLLAAFNSTNLAVSQSSVRFKEICVRRTAGAGRLEIVRQFLTEALVMSFLALALGFVLATLFLPRFNAFAGRRLALSFFLSGPYLVLTPGIALFVGLAAGIYPALALSKMRPAADFRNKSRAGKKITLGRLLVVFQFGISTFLIIGALTMAGQLRMIGARDLGYDPRGVIMIPTYSFWFGQDSGDRTLEVFKNEVANRPEILSVSGASGLLNPGWVPSAIIDLVKEDQVIRAPLFRVDPDFLETLGIPLLQGRNFSPRYATDATEGVLVNEAFVRRFGLTDPLGKRFSDFARDPRPAGHEFNGVIIGVFRDYHFESLRREVEPLVLSWSGHDDRYGFVLIKAASDSLPKTLTFLRAAWSRVQPDKPFHYEFLENVLARQYESERSWGRIIGWATAFAIFIAGLGLFGLSSMTIARRTKEIGIRKVLGASSAGIVGLVSREFMAAVAAANVLAWPMAYFAMRQWLQGFAVRVALGPGVFLLAAVLVLAVSLLTVSVKSVQAAMADPVDSLRYE
jgi:putative ABC transport system permease protein